MGPCPNPFAACEAPEYSCVCTPHCPDTARCGDDDGCGGRCTTGCGVGEMCDPVMRRCICVSRCPAPERFIEFGCGMPVPNECPGGPVCGLGTGCPMGFRCSAETNVTVHGDVR